MTIAYWTIFLMTLYPYVFVGLAKSIKGFDHSKPRAYAGKLTGWRQRAYWIQENGYEILPAFIGAVLISQELAGKTHQDSINHACIFFVLARIAYAIAYLRNMVIPRTFCWSLSFITLFYLYGLAALA